MWKIMLFAQEPLGTNMGTEAHTWNEMVSGCQVKRLEPTYQEKVLGWRSGWLGVRFDGRRGLRSWREALDLI